MNWTLVLAPVLGLVGALIGGLVAPLVTAGRTRALWLLQQRADLYTNLMRFMIDMEEFVGHMSGRRPLDLAAFDALIEAAKQLLPRLDVLASDPVMKAYAEVMTAYMAFSAVGGPGTSSRREVAPDDPLIADMEAATRSVRRACRKAMLPRGPLGLRRG